MWLSGEEMRRIKGVIAEMYREKRRILAGLLVFALIFSSGTVSASAGGEQDGSGGLCVHHPQHTEECGYVDGANGNLCTYVCNACASESDNEGEESSESTNELAEDGNAAETTADSAANDTEAALTELVAWAWVDEEGYLSERDGCWGLGIPGATEENPLTRDVLASMLPDQITAETADGENVTVDIIWDLSAIPEEGAWSGEYEVAAQVDGTYKLMEDNAPLEVIVQVGGAETYDFADHTVQGVSPQGTTINLFDYWNTDDENVPEPTGDTEKGINKGHQLHFNEGTSGNLLNSWTFAGNGPRQGMVKSTLQNGYPVLKEQTIKGEANYGDNKQYVTTDVKEESLSYLFNEYDTETPGENRVEGKRAYRNVQNLLQIDDDGYYYYNASSNNIGKYKSANFASFNPETNSFTLYNTWAVNPNGFYSSHGQFFPFNSAEDVFLTYGGQIWGKNILSSNDVLKHYFGLSMTSRFVQKDGGTNKEKPVTYEFSGDDDVWVFIDNVLVGDLGGIHDAASLHIDFSTGDVTVTSANDQVVQKTTLRDLYTKALGTSFNENLFGPGTDTFADNTYHTLNFFYLERGNNDSNMSLKFNLVTIPESSLIKVDQAGAPVVGAGFSLYAADDKYQYEEKDLIASGTTDEEGSFIFVNPTNGQLLTLSEIAMASVYSHLVLEETYTPPGYRSIGKYKFYFDKYGSDGDKWVLLSADQWETGAYASARVTAQAPDKVYDMQGTEHDLSTGTMFAVILQYQRNDEDGLQDIGNWKAVYGNPIDGWHVEEDADRESLLKAAKENPYEFELTTNGSYDVTIEDLPGDIKSYYYMLDDNDKGQTKYTVGYFYTDANSLENITADNPIFRINADYDPGAFERVFSVNLYVPNIKNNLYVQKLDENGNPVSAAETSGQATFALYKEDDVTFQQDGTYQINSGVQAYMTETTADMENPLPLVGGAMFTEIQNGEYYLIETEAPEGYVKNTKAIHIIVNESGVYADAGDDSDDVAVRRGVGSIVKSMVQFATDDDIDTTLHDITASLQTKDDFGDAWQPAGDNSILHLQFDNGYQTLEYGPLKKDEQFYFETETGWSNLEIHQCEEHSADGSDDLKQSIEKDKNLVNLFSGSVTVLVRNAHESSLTIRKTVEGNAQADEEFKFIISLADGNDNENEIPATEKFEAEKGRDGTVERLQIGNGDKFTLKDGEYISIYGLPDNTWYSVTETEDEDYRTSVTVDGVLSSEPNTGYGDVRNGAAAEVVFTNTYIEKAEFSFEKTDAEDTPLEGAEFAVYRLNCTNTYHNHDQELIEVEDNGTVSSEFEHRGCWEKVGENQSSALGTGMVTFESLAEGEYRLVEIKAPDGYTLPEGQWKIEYSKDLEKFVPKSGTGASVGNPPAIEEVKDQSGNVTGYRIRNYKPTELPFSGNIGTTIFLISGAVLMIFGGIGGTWYYMSHRRPVKARYYHRRRKQGKY